MSKLEIRNRTHRRSSECPTLPFAVSSFVRRASSLIRHSSFVIRICGTAAVLVAALAHAATPVTLIGPDLEPKRVNLQGLDDESLSFFDADRQYRTQSIDRVLQLRDLGNPGSPASPATPTTGTPTAVKPSSLGFIETADGQKIFGSLDLERTKRDKIAWSNSTLGVIEISVDDLRTLALKSMSTPAKNDAKNPAREDQIVLANGDSVTGFVVGAGPDGVEMKPPAGGDPVKLPWDRLRGFVLFNAAPRKQQPAHRVWLNDGSRLLVRNLSLVGEQLAFKPLLKPLVPPTATATTQPADAAADAPAKDTFSLAIGKISRIDLFATADPARATRRLVELGDLPPKLVSGGEVFGVPLAPYVDDQGLHMHAPVRIAFTLPPGAKRVAAIAELDLAPEAPRPIMATRPVAAAQPQGQQPGFVGNMNGRQMVVINGQLVQLPLGGGRARVVQPAAKAGEGDANKSAKAEVITSPQDAGMSLGLRGDREADAVWADFELIAYVNQKEVGRFHIDAKSRRVRINLPLDESAAPPAAPGPSTLEFELMPGLNGPVMDRLRISDAVILVVPQ